MERVYTERRNDRGANWVRVDGMLTFPWRECYMYIDSAERYEADGIFIKNGISVCFKSGQYYNGGKYRCVFCSVRKTDRGAFLSAMEELTKKHLLKGDVDYPDFCEEIMDILACA